MRSVRKHVDGLYSIGRIASVHHYGHLVGERVRVARNVHDSTRFDSTEYAFEDVRRTALPRRIEHDRVVAIML